MRVTVCSRPRLVEHCFGVLRQAALEVERIEFFIDEARRGRQRITVVARPCGSRQVVDFIRAVGGSDPVIDWGRA